MGYLEAVAFAVRSTYHSTKQQIPGEILFGIDMILPINHVADWRYIRQRKQTQIDKDIIWENTTTIYYGYRVGDQVMLGNKFAFKYITPFKGPYETIQMRTNRSVTLQTGSATTRLNICRIKPYYNNKDMNVFNQNELKTYIYQQHIYKQQINIGTYIYNITLIHNNFLWQDHFSFTYTKQELLWRSHLFFTVTEVSSMYVLFSLPY